MPARFYLFPSAYFILWLPAIMLAHPGGRLWIAAINIGVAASGNRQTFPRLTKFGLLSLLIFLLFALIVRSAICSTESEYAPWTLAACAGRSALPTISTAIALVTTFLMAAALEWRGSLLATVNGLGMPRDLRVICSIAGSLLGDFSRASSRIHHATTARGSASPKFSIRNIVALPRLVANIWATVLTAAAARLALQWSSQEFWERYVPAKIGETARAPLRDLLVVGAGIAILAAVLLDRLMHFL